MDKNKLAKFLNEYANWKISKNSPEKEQHQETVEKLKTYYANPKKPLVIMTSSGNSHLDTSSPHNSIEAQKAFQKRHGLSPRSYFVINNINNAHWDCTFVDAEDSKKSLESSGAGLACGIYTIFNIIICLKITNQRILSRLANDLYNQIKPKIEIDNKTNSNSLDDKYVRKLLCDIVRTKEPESPMLTTIQQDGYQLTTDDILSCFKILEIPAHYSVEFDLPTDSHDLISNIKNNLSVKSQNEQSRYFEEENQTLVEYISTLPSSEGITVEGVLLGIQGGSLSQSNLEKVEQEKEKEEVPSDLSFYAEVKDYDFYEIFSIEQDLPGKIKPKKFDQNFISAISFDWGKLIQHNYIEYRDSSDTSSDRDAKNIFFKKTTDTPSANVTTWTITQEISNELKISCCETPEQLKNLLKNLKIKEQSVIFFILEGSKVAEYKNIILAYSKQDKTWMNFISKSISTFFYKETSQLPEKYERVIMMLYKNNPKKNDYTVVELNYKEEKNNNKFIFINSDKQEVNFSTIYFLKVEGKESTHILNFLGEKCCSSNNADKSLYEMLVAIHKELNKGIISDLLIRQYYEKGYYQRIINILEKVNNINQWDSILAQHWLIVNLTQAKYFMASDHYDGERVNNILSNLASYLSNKKKPTNNEDRFEDVLETYVNLLFYIESLNLNPEKEKLEVIDKQLIARLQGKTKPNYYLYKWRSEIKENRASVDWTAFKLDCEVTIVDFNNNSNIDDGFVNSCLNFIQYYFYAALLCGKMLNDTENDNVIISLIEKPDLNNTYKKKFINLFLVVVLERIADWYIQKSLGKDFYNKISDLLNKLVHNHFISIIPEHEAHMLDFLSKILLAPLCYFEENFDDPDAIFSPKKLKIIENLLKNVIAKLKNYEVQNGLLQKSLPSGTDDRVEYGLDNKWIAHFRLKSSDCYMGKQHEYEYGYSLDTMKNTDGKESHNVYRLKTKHLFVGADQAESVEEKIEEIAVNYNHFFQKAENFWYELGGSQALCFAPEPSQYVSGVLMNKDQSAIYTGKFSFQSCEPMVLIPYGMVAVSLTKEINNPSEVYNHLELYNNEGKLLYKSKSMKNEPQVQTFREVENSFYTKNLVLKKYQDLVLEKYQILQEQLKSYFVDQYALDTTYKFCEQFGQTGIFIENDYIDPQEVINLGERLDAGLNSFCKIVDLLSAMNRYKKLENLSDREINDSKIFVTFQEAEFRKLFLYWFSEDLGKLYTPVFSDLSQYIQYICTFFIKHMPPQGWEKEKRDEFLKCLMSASTTDWSQFKLKDKIMVLQLQKLKMFFNDSVHRIFEGERLHEVFLPKGTPFDEINPERLKEIFSNLDVTNVDFQFSFLKHYFFNLATGKNYKLVIQNSFEFFKEKSLDKVKIVDYLYQIDSAYQNLYSTFSKKDKAQDYIDQWFLGQVSFLEKIRSEDELSMLNKYYEYIAKTDFSAYCDDDNSKRKVPTKKENEIEENYTIFRKISSIVLKIMKIEYANTDDLRLKSLQVLHHVGSGILQKFDRQKIDSTIISSFRELMHSVSDTFDVILKVNSHDPSHIFDLISSEIGNFDVLFDMNIIQMTKEEAIKTYILNNVPEKKEIDVNKSLEEVISKIERGSANSNSKWTCNYSERIFRLLSAHESYEEQYDKFLDKRNFADVKTYTDYFDNKLTAIQADNNEIIQNTSDVEECKAKLLGNFSFLLSVLCCEAAFTPSEKNNLKITVKLHYMQIFTILEILTFNDNTGKNNHSFAQILTGQGKSHTLFMCALIMATMNPSKEIYVICYDHILVNRDKVAYAKILEKMGSNIKYSTVLDFSKKMNIYENLAINITNLIQNKDLKYLKEVTRGITKKVILLIDELDVFLQHNLYAGSHLPTFSLYANEFTKLFDNMYSFANIKVSIMNNLKRDLDPNSEIYEELSTQLIELNTCYEYDTKNYKKSSPENSGGKKFITFKNPEETYGEAYCIVGDEKRMKGLSYGTPTHYVRQILAEKYLSGKNPTFALRLAYASCSLVCALKDQLIDTIIGVSGTFELNATEQAMLKMISVNFEEKSLLKAPSFFGNKDMRKGGSKNNDIIKLFKKDEKASNEDFYECVYTKIAQKHKRPCILLFDSLDVLNEFNKYFERKEKERKNDCGEHEYEEKTKYFLTADSKPHEIQTCVQNAGGENSITFATKDYARGTDFKPSEAAEVHGGTLLIATYFPSSKKDRIQIEGRVARRHYHGEICYILLLESNAFKEFTDNSESKFQELTYKTIEVKADELYENYLIKIQNDGKDKIDKHTNLETLVTLFNSFNTSEDKKEKRRNILNELNELNKLIKNKKIIKV